MTPGWGNEIAISLYTYWPLMAPSMVAFEDKDVCRTEQI